MDTSIETFHTNCLMPWNTYNCPVCYYIKNPNLLKKSICMKCGAKSSVWFCIICAHVGCGYDQGHAWEHFEETAHNFAIDVNTFYVWDFKIKKVLHKLNGNEQKPNNFHSYPENFKETDCSCLICQQIRIVTLLKQSVCMKCAKSQAETLWMCLYCSHIGCGRHYNGHALEHFTKTNHPYAMQMVNFSIWDYKEKKYLHRQMHEAIVKNELVEYDRQKISKLNEVNKKIFSIEERLHKLTAEKKILGTKLLEYEHKFNEFLEKIPKKPLTNNSDQNDLEVHNLKIEEISKTIENKNLKDKLVIINPAKSCQQIKISKVFYLMITGLCIHHFLIFIVKVFFRSITSAVKMGDYY